MSDLRNRIYIGKLHYDVREKDIERFFKDFGKINDINMKNGYAFVVRLFCWPGLYNLLDQFEIEYLIFIAINKLMVLKD